MNKVNFCASLLANPYLAIDPRFAVAFVSGELPLTRSAPRADMGEDCVPPTPDHPYERQGGVGIVEIDGPLLQHGGWWYDGHGAIRLRCTAALADRSVRILALRIDSPGGVVAGCFDAVRAVRALAAELGKPVLAWCGGDGGYSAGYAWACVAEHISVTDTSGDGSVGVLATLTDWSKFNARMGIRVVVVRSGKRKAEGHPDIPLDDATIANEQAVIDSMASIFAGDIVSPVRRMSAAEILALEGACYYGTEAVRVGLADEVESFDAFLMRCQARAEEIQMKGIAQRLGLAADASEASIIEAVDRRERDAAASLAKAEKERDAAASAKSEIAATLADEVAEHALETGRATKAEIDALRADVKDPLALRRIVGARAMGAALPKDRVEDSAAPQRKGNAAPKSAAEMAEAYGKMSNVQRADLAKSDKPLFESMRAAWRESTKGASAQGSN